MNNLALVNNLAMNTFDFISKFVMDCQEFYEFFDNFFFRSSDEGKYTCVRTNEAGSVNAEAWISVLVRTQIIQPPVDTKVILGKYSY